MGPAAVEITIRDAEEAAHTCRHHAWKILPGLQRRAASNATFICLPDAVAAMFVARNWPFYPPPPMCCSQSASQPANGASSEEVVNSSVPSGLPLVGFTMAVCAWKHVIILYLPGSCQHPQTFV